MLTKNIYILYPAGYGGSYIHWAINISDIDLFQNTIKNPLNLSNSKKFGGIGTAHLHTRIPTHQGLYETLHWKIYNKHNDNRIFLVNIHPDRDNAKIIKELMMSDPTGVFINIHDEANFLIRSYGFINQVIKWPEFLHVSRFNGFTLHENFDIFNCSKDIIFRNYCVLNMNILCDNPPIDFLILTSYLNRRKEWFKKRNESQPHEVNKNYYVDNYEIKNRIFELNCHDISTDKFPKILKRIMQESCISDNFNLEYIEEFHPNYVGKQANLQWFKSFENWEKTGEIDDFLQSHSIIESIIIEFILANDERLTKMPWKNMPLTNLNKIYQHLKNK